MTLSTTEKIDRLEDAALDRLYSFLRTKGGTDEDRTDARIAATTLSAITRRRATDGAREALAFAMARSLTSDPERLAEYIRVSQPSGPLTPALTTAE